MAALAIRRGPAAAVAGGLGGRHGERRCRPERGNLFAPDADSMTCAGPRLSDGAPALRKQFDAAHRNWK